MPRQRSNVSLPGTGMETFGQTHVRGQETTAFNISAFWFRCGGLQDAEDGAVSAIMGFGDV